MRYANAPKILLAIVVTLMAIAGPLAAQKPGLITTEITVTTADSLTLHGWITYTPERARAPLIVCLPMMSNDHFSFDSFGQAVIENALLSKRPVPYILALDLRGHGKSNVRGKDTLVGPKMPAAEFANFPSDVAAIIHAAIHDSVYHIDTTDIRIVGASIGANTAPWVTQGVAGVTSLALLSPGEDYRGVKPAEALKTYKGEILLVASENDEYAYQSVTALAKAVPSAKVLTYSGNAHGTDIIEEQPAAMKAVVNWVMGK